MKQYRLDTLSDLELPLVNKFYKYCRYSAKAGRGEAVFVIRCVMTGTPEIVAAVRLQPKPDGWYFLRSMCVAPELRGQGIGRQLLNGLSDFLSQHRCYCYPFDHLETLYGFVGFQCCSQGDVPSFISQAFDRYTQQGRKISLMVYQHKD